MFKTRSTKPNTLTTPSFLIDLKHSPMFPLSPTSWSDSVSKIWIIFILTQTYIRLFYPLNSILIITFWLYKRFFFYSPSNITFKLPLKKFAPFFCFHLKVIAKAFSIVLQGKREREREKKMNSFTLKDNWINNSEKMHCFLRIWDLSEKICFHVFTLPGVAWLIIFGEQFSFLFLMRYYIYCIIYIKVEVEVNIWGWKKIENIIWQNGM